MDSIGKSLIDALSRHSSIPRIHIVNRVAVFRPLPDDDAELFGLGCGGHDLEIDVSRA
jgi:hypothetical protein